MLDLFIKSMITSFYKLYLWVRGESTVTELFRHSKIIGSVKREFVEGYTLEIFCRRRQYVKKYHGSYFRGRIYTVFDVYSQTQDNAPMYIQRASLITISFPPLAPPFVDEHYHCRILINAYLDMLRIKLKEN